MSRVRGVLCNEDLMATARYLRSVQLDSGMVPWYRGGHADVWNHCEAVIALGLTGYLDEALLGLEWVREIQNRDGSFAHYFLERGVEEPRRDLNCCLYPAVAVYLVYLRTGDEEILERFGEMVIGALDFVLGLQRVDGSFPWSIDPDGRVAIGTLLAASSSLLSSLDAARKVAALMGRRVERIETATEHLREAMQSNRISFDDKGDWAMDWYYPILGGASDPEATRYRMGHLLVHHFDRDGGVRCLASKPWITTAETSEFAMAASLAGYPDLGRFALSSVAQMRLDDGSYLTGRSLPTGLSFPRDERSTYSAAAVVLADYVVASGTQGTLLEALEAICVATVEDEPESVLSA